MTKPTDVQNWQTDVFNIWVLGRLAFGCNFLQTKLNSNFPKTNYISLLVTAFNANDHVLINKQTLISQNLLIFSSKVSLSSCLNWDILQYDRESNSLLWLVKYYIINIEFKLLGFRDHGIIDFRSNFIGNTRNRESPILKYLHVRMKLLTVSVL